MIGRTISHYKIVAKLGEGGMGEVYRAEDTSLGRPVALKFLASHLLNDAEAKQRFLREAKAAAAIRHPNICTVFEVAEEGDQTFLAMDCLEGESLEDRIAKGPLPLKDALEIGRQIAEGLEAAHEKGIVHRDIKPANVMVDAKGHATILDFGLARLAEASKLTRADQTVGTVAYMSPEQIQGGEIDHRTDIWALGCTLYEMVAGVRPFKGQYDQALAYEICNEEPEPLTGLRTGVPIELELLIAKCLAKEPGDRYQHVNEIAVDLRTLGEKLKSGRSTVRRTSRVTSEQAEVQAHGPVASSPAPRQRVWQAAAGLLGLIALAFAVAYFQARSPEPEPRPVRRFSFSHPDIGFASISPDGLHIAFSARGEDGLYSLWLRSLESESVRELPGTQGAGGFIGAWSPDSRSILFDADDQLKRVSIDGGDPAALCTLPEGSGQYPFIGGAYSPDGERIVFSSWLKLWEIPARGGEPRLLFEPEGAYWAPHFLPTGEGSRYLIYSAQTDAVRRTELFDSRTGERKLIAPGQAGVYAPGGFIIHGTDEDGGQGLFAMPFSLATLSATGDPIPLSESSASNSPASVSQEGTLVYVDGSASGTRIVIRDRTGEVVQTVGEPSSSFVSPAVSTDGRRAAVVNDRAIWVYDLERNARIRLTPPGDALPWGPSWLPGDRQIAFYRDSKVLIQAADGSSEAVVAFERSSRPYFSPDGRYVAYSGGDPAGGERGIWYREVAEDGSFSEPISWLRTPNAEQQPRFSPDGKYLAYQSDESGRFEIYVRPFPEGPGRWLVSTNGGNEPAWSADGQELFYRNGLALMAAPVSTEGAFQPGTSERLFETADLGTGTGIRYDVFPDGQRFLMIRREGFGNAIRVIQNWDQLLRSREQ